MALSNTAVPIYYGKFRDAVLAGEIPVNQYVGMEMERIDRLIENPGVFYDDGAVEGFIRFCEKELTLTDGSPLHMLDSFKLWAEEVYGWYYYVERTVYVRNKKHGGGRYVQKLVKKRLTKKQYLIVGRGAAKSMYASCIQTHTLVMDPDTTEQIVTAPTMKQAEETLSPIRTAIVRSRGPLFRFLTDGSVRNTRGSAASQVMLLSTKKGIENRCTNSSIEIRPMTVDKLQGLRCKLASVDEWLSGDIREDPIGALEQSAAKNDMDYLILAISSEGTVRNAVGDTIKMELLDILRGKYENPHVSIWYYRLDDEKEVGDPEMWVKANPNIGLGTVTYEDYQLDVERAENVPSVKNDILAKRFGIPMEGFTYFFTYEETLPQERKRDYWKMPCALGADLSMGDDFCAFTFLFPLNNGSFGVKTRCYISSVTYQQLPLAMKKKYNEFINEDSLAVMEGVTLDINEVYDDLDQYILDHNYEDVRAFGFDPYNAKTFVDRWMAENGGDYGVEKVIQGARTESVPLGELKKLSENRMLLFDQELMSFCMSNCIAIKDTNGNKKLYKKRNDEKIDSVAAMMDAYIAYKLHTDDFE